MQMGSRATMAMTQLKLASAESFRAKESCLLVSTSVLRSI